MKNGYLKSASELYQSGKLQHAAWQYFEDQDQKRSEEIYNEIEEILIESKIDESKTQPEDDLRGVNKTFRVYFLNTHITALFKENSINDVGNIKFELAAYMLSRELGFNLVPVVVIRTIEVRGVKYSGSLMYWINDAKSASSAGLTKLNKPDILLFFDAILSNADRHLENWMVSPQKRIIAVDHNRSFFHKNNFWINHLQSIRNLKKIRESLQYSRLKQISRVQFDRVIKVISEKHRNNAWLVREKIIFEIEKSSELKGLIMIVNEMLGFVQFNLLQPILTKNSEVEKFLLNIVKTYMPHEGLGSRQDGLFSILIRDNGETKTAFGGLKVFKKDATLIKELLVKEGFIIRKN